MTQACARPIIFLDFDDVLCLNSPYGGYDAKIALAHRGAEQESDAGPALWSNLFDAAAKRNLQTVDEQFSPQYVLSTSWTWLFEKDELIDVLQRCGLNFVANNLHESWTTPKQAKPGLRAAEVRGWLALHPESGHAWAVLDDKYSGTGFKNWSRQALSQVVLCQVGVGFQRLELEQMQSLLERQVMPP